MLDILSPSFTFDVYESIIFRSFELNHDKWGLVTWLIVEGVILCIDDQRMIFDGADVFLIEIILIFNVYDEESTKV